MLGRAIVARDQWAKNGAWSFVGPGTDTEQVGRRDRKHSLGPVVSAACEGVKVIAGCQALLCLLLAV